MPDKTERVFVQVMTAANVQGVESAATSFIGLNVQTALAIAAIAAVIEVSKEAIANTRALETSVNDLNQAIDAFNSGYGKAIPLGEKQIADLQKAQADYARARDALQLFDLEHQKRAKTAQEQEVIDFRRAELQQKLAEAQRQLTAAEAESATQKQTAVIYQEGMNRELDAFLEKNKAFISDQYDTREALASAIRAGNDSHAAMRLLDDSLDLAALRHESVSEAMKSLILAENGNSKGLRDLGISSDEYNAIMQSSLTTEQKHAALMELIEEKTAGGRDTTDKLDQAQNKLNKDWQDFTVMLGAVVIPVVDAIIEAADWGLNALEGLPKALQDFFAGGGNQALAASSRRAEGGPVEPGRVYTVGERGPETLVTGSRAGYAAPLIHIDLRGAFIPDEARIDALADLIVQQVTSARGRWN